MSDVFVSYKAEDRARVRPLVEALEADGLSVWWDAHIGGGDDWRETIACQLDEARCVIVAWSKRSTDVEGRFVRDEATRALRRHVYLPVRIDKVDPPLGFGETQALPLIGWKGDLADPRFQAVLTAARAIIEGRPRVARTSAANDGRVSRRVLIAGSAAAATAVGVGGWYFFNANSAAASDSIAVLPFANLSGDPAQAYFSDGIAEELRSALARITRFKVVGRTSSEVVRDADATIAAEKLGVANILTGSVRRSPATIRISAQLVNGTTGIERWSQNYDRAPGDALQIQTSIAENVAGTLSIQLGRAEKAALTLGGTASAGARDLYLKAVALRQSDDAEAVMRRSLALFDSAILLDPGYAAAHARRSLELRALAAQYATSPEQMNIGFEQAVAAAKLAVALAPEFAPGYSALGNALFHQLNFAGAFDQLRNAYRLAPGDVDVLFAFASALSWASKAEHALSLADRAEVLDPLNPTSLLTKANDLFYARRYAAAADLYQRALVMAPDRTNGLPFLASSLILLGRARESLATLNKLPANDWRRLSATAIVRARMGDRAAADRALAKFAAINNGVFGYQFAQIRAQRNEIDQAFAALDQAWVTRDPGLVITQVDPFLDPLKSDPRFAAVVRKLNFP
ncbi:MAG TPA: TIR domain-containing protein [Novosphingobium sp.]|nr:TIR domain-containing protein [Novosphingobium sp.]